MRWDDSGTGDALWYTTRDPALEDLLGRGSLGGGVVPPTPRTGYVGETPVEGEGATARWAALHDRARDLRAALRPGDVVGERQARRAVRSLFLYEHQLTPRARRRARTLLWARDRPGEAPPFAERVRWARCRCAGCTRPQGAAASMTRAGICLQSA